MMGWLEEGMFEILRMKILKLFLILKEFSKLEGTRERKGR